MRQRGIRIVKILNALKKFPIRIEQRIILYASVLGVNVFFRKVQSARRFQNKKFQLPEAPFRCSRMNNATLRFLKNQSLKFQKSFRRPEIFFQQKFFQNLQKNSIFKPYIFFSPGYTISIHKGSFH